MKSTDQPSYLGVLATFLRNSLVRDMTFRINFIVEAVAGVSWTVIMFLFYVLIFQYSSEIGKGTGWTRYPYFVFLGTAMIINSLVEAFFMLNTQQFSEQIRTGKLDFALLKPIDTQFLVSLERVDWSSLTNTAFGCVLLGWALHHLDYEPSLLNAGLYVFFVACGVLIMYSALLAVASTSVWMGRNQSMTDFFFYFTTFSRYPMEIYQGKFGQPLRIAFTYFFPILLAINVPARQLAKAMSGDDVRLAWVALAATVGSLWVSRRIFKLALRSYRSASS